ncbi:hypothetical protein GCM10018793_31760 [Streptomyces sulfonofaciens]|uniref:Sugar kinase n=1 Tax=Streptomyces sulfonofaciens TaxID=68272 RepID=A0A919G717_9ACTN|nr:sugar kinase [Streptomyces sulfonofaciens]GHH79307.1 hypothetical protein GCM10018793_31760 [Streptomyces sulfonofaciens]
MSTAEPNTAERTDVRAQAPQAPQEPAEDRRRVIRRRTLTLSIIVLLIGIPAGYLIISANQSRDSGKDKEARYAATGLTGGTPSKVQQRLYNVPIPYQHAAVSYYETNNWKTSRLYVQFLTTNQGLDTFLKAMGTSQAALRKGDLPISARDRRIVDWDFSGTGDWRGLTHRRKDPLPTQKIVVNRSNPRYPEVFVVSATTP